MSAAAPITHAPTALWAVARGFIVTFFQLFGDPGQIAAQHTLTAKAYRLALDWLRAGEALMRRLLLIEAAHYEKTSARPSMRAPRTRTRQPVAFQADNPEAWRVSFRCFAERQVPARKQGRRHEPKCFYSAWPLAERAEAMLRAFNNPAPYAKRFARRLHEAPQRARTLLAHPANAPDLIGPDSFAETRDPAEAAVKRFEPG